MGLRNKRPRKVIYSVSKKGVKSGEKVQKAMSHYHFLQKRLAFEGETKWLLNAREFVVAKLKKYAIPLNRL